MLFFLSSESIFEIMTRVEKLPSIGMLFFSSESFSVNVLFLLNRADRLQSLFSFVPHSQTGLSGSGKICQFLASICQMISPMTSVWTPSSLEMGESGS